MSYPLEKATKVGQEILERLKPYCDQIEILGSIRRGKKFVSDVELLFVPRMESRQKDFFSCEPFDLANEEIGKLLNEGILAKRPNEAGIFAWGAQNKLATHIASGIPIDLFSTKTENWFVAKVIRTGSKQTNLDLTMGANRLNRTLNAYGCGVTDRQTGKITQATSEEHVFELCGVKYKEPEQR